jgi:ketosteroid isomerase-like protein
MSTDDGAIDQIKALEDRRYQAMIDGDAAVLDALCSRNLIYTHSRGDNDDKNSYIEKVASGFFDYHEITHPADRVMIYDGAALVTGRMTAKISAGGELKHVDNRYLAVWAREDGAWKFVAYQPTPIVGG